MLSPKKLAETFSDHYVSRLDLGQDPFDRNFQSSYFYPGGERRKVLEQLVHYGRFSKQPILLAGEAGSGKDKIIKEVVEQLQSVMDCCRLSVELLTNQQAIMSALAERLGLKLDAQCSLQSFVDALKFTLGDHEDIEPFLLVIEKVQLLSAEEIEFLFDLQKAGHGAIHMLLVADEVTATLEVFCGDGQEALKAITLRALSQQETIEYVMGVLQSVGYAGGMPLTKEQWQELHGKAQGNFYAIKEWMPQILMSVDAVNRQEKSFGIPITHIIAVSIISTAIGVAYLYQGDKAEESKDQSKRRQQEVPIQSLVETGSDVAAEQAEEDVKPKDSLIMTPEPLAEPSMNENAGVGKELVETKTPEQDKQTKKPVLTEKVPAEEAEVEAKPLSTEIKKPAISNKEKSTEVEQADAPRYNAREQRLLNMPEQAYMLQLIGTRKEGSAKDFVATYIKQLPLTYFETELKGQPWFVVVVGPYDNRVEALAAIKRLPSKLQKQKPWARSMAGIQAEILK